MAREDDIRIMNNIIQKTYREIDKKNRGEISQSKLKNEVVNLVKEEVKNNGN